jgi:hypothetical protein
MALVLFPSGVPRSDAATRRIQEAEDLKTQLLSREYTTEIYGPASAEGFDVKPEELMPNPDELSARWGFQDIDSICNDMGSNVLQYGALVEGRMDVAMQMELTWLPGVKGDAESETARDEVQACYEAIPERHVVEREMTRSAERGFMGAENVYDLLSTGPAKGLVGIVGMFNRPANYFAFDWLHRPWLKRHGRTDNPIRIDDFKVTFARQGSLHTRYGAGYAQRCYPTVFMADTILKQHMAAVERWSWVPIIVTHPMNWSNDRRRREHAILKQQWKNVLLVPGEVDQPKYTSLTDGAYTNSNATGASRMILFDTLIAALAQFVRGSQSSGALQVGSFAKEETVDNAQMWKAPTDAAAREAMWNRGLVEPFMLANHPAMDRAKWPRCSVESSFGEDVALFLQACETGVRMGVPISHVTFSERTGVALAKEGEPILEAPSVAPILPDGLAADEVEDPSTGIVRRMSEPASIRIQLADHRVAWVRPSTPILTDKGIVMARNLTGGGHEKIISAGSAKFGRVAS